MRSSYGFLVLAAAAVAGYFFWQNYRVTGIDQLRVEPKREARERVREASDSRSVPARGVASIRVASFNLQGFSEAKLAKPHVVETIAKILRQYDVVALQEVRSRSQDTLPLLVEALNASGAQYDYVIGPRTGRTVAKEQYAFLFDRATIEVDRNQTYTVEDPDDVLEHDPLVGWFRVRGPPKDQAFTFSLVNLHVDAERVREEVNVLDDVFRAVRTDGRDEDDVILLGTLNTDDRHLGQLGQSSSTVAAVSGAATMVRGGAQVDNLLFDELATVEFTGRAGVFDFLREFNYTLEQAVEVSEHLPVWAEFSAYEGGTTGKVAESRGRRDEARRD